MKKIKAILGKIPYWMRIISCILFIWNYKEIVCQCEDGGCFFLKNIGIIEIVKTIGENGVKSIPLFLHSLYHNIEDLSLVHAASFFSLFAMVIALIQAIYPYRLGEMYGYPITRLKRTFDKQREVCELIFCAFVAVVAELLKLHILEAGIVSIGYVIIGKWIYEIVKWYETFENKKLGFIEQFKNDLQMVLKTEDKNVTEEKEIYELMERLIRSGGVEEREILEAMALNLYQFKESLSEKQCQKIFEITFYMAQMIIENNLTDNHTENSWNFKMLKECILKSGCQIKEQDESICQMKVQEVFIMGILCGCLSENNFDVSRWCIYDVLFAIHKQMSRKNVMELTGMFLVFLELYCNISEEAVYGIDMIAKGNYFISNMGDTLYFPNVKIKMERFYHMLLRSNQVDAITEYDLVDTLLQESKDMQTGIPKTVFGIMRAFSGKR